MPQHGILFVGVMIARIIEECHEFVILFMTKRIVRVAVTLHASEGCALQRFPRRVHTINHCGDAKLFVIGAALIVGHRVAMERRGNKLRFSWIRQQITRKLLGEKLIIRFIVVKRTDYPIAVAPDAAGIIALVTFGIGIAREIKPHRGPTLTEAR
ncbi:MAG: hypothetical protein ALAOOOJD_03570 [bacterium]|nr:hypothetical protein [bacterium]